MVVKTVEGPFLPLELPDPGSLDLDKSFSRISLAASTSPDRTSADAGIQINVVRCEDVDLNGIQAVDNDSGAKVWEGGLDLASFLASPRPGLHRGARVLELGAGHGLPGIVAAMQHGVCVDFHDKSPGVLRTVTAPNVSANGLGRPVARGTASGSQEDSAAVSLAAQPSAARFLAGDWQELCKAAQASGLKYDAVLAAEAIYRSEMYTDIAALLDQCLAEDGIAWFAGKRFYFGCGGGTASFAVFLRERGFDAVVEQVIEDGRSNVREILRIARVQGQGHQGEEDTGAGEVAATDMPTADGDAGGKREREQLSDTPGEDSNKNRKLAHPE